LIADTEEQLQQLITAVHNSSQIFGLKMKAMTIAISKERFTEY